MISLNFNLTLRNQAFIILVNVIKVFLINYDRKRFIIMLKVKINLIKIGSYVFLYC
jgi:hypothetical protein